MNQLQFFVTGFTDVQPAWTETYCTKKFCICSDCLCLNWICK